MHPIATGGRGRKWDLKPKQYFTRLWLQILWAGAGVKREWSATVCVRVCWGKRAVGEAVRENHDGCMLACFHLRFSSVCVSPFFRWLTCFFSCLLNIPGWEHDGNDPTLKIKKKYNGRLYLEGFLKVMTTDSTLWTSHVPSSGDGCNWDGSLLFMVPNNFRLYFFPPPQAHLSADFSTFACEVDNKLCQELDHPIDDPMAFPFG